MSPAEIVAREIEPQAWAAAGVGDTLAYRNRRVSSQRKAERILAALEAAGFVIAPVEPLPEMVRAAAERERSSRRGELTLANAIRGDYRAMIAARPK